jgi:hypothetical protein
MTATPSNPVQSCQPITEDSPMTDRPSPDIVERLRSHAPSMGYGGCQDCYDLVMEDAADEIERLRAQIQPATPTAGEPVMWCGWHPEHGYAAQTCGHNEQHASSLLMRTAIAGNHGWSVVPLYPATGGDAVAGDGEAATAPQSIETLLSAWRMDARQLEEAAEQEDISDEEHTLNKYIAKQIRDCIEQLERAQWDVSAATGRKSLADWSGLPRDLYVTEVKSDDGIVFDVHCCSVPMAIGPEVRYSLSNGVAQCAWQPIETAPHAKRVLLGWRDWRDHQWCVEVGPATSGQRFDNGYSSLSQHGSATHWQPIPEGPAVTSTTRETTK